MFFSCAYSDCLWSKLKPLARLDNLSNISAEVISGIYVKRVAIPFGVLSKDLFLGLLSMGFGKKETLDCLSIRIDLLRFYFIRV